MRNLLIWVREHPRVTLMLRLYSYASVAIFAAAAVMDIYSAYCSSQVSVAGLIISLGIPFIAVTLLRRAINAACPYEVYSDIFDTVPKQRRGESFPSRHAYSAFAIAVCTFPVSVALGCVLALLAVLICISRVLLGIHFLRDVATGALIGIISQVIGLLIIQPF